MLAGICLGIGYSFPFWKGRAKLRLFQIHKISTITGTLIALLHGIFPVISPYMPFTWHEVLIPFAAENHRILNGIGTLAAYALILLILTSDIRNLLGRKLWIATHMLSYPMFIVVWIHSYFIGSDTASLAVRWMYLLSVVLILGLTAARYMIHKPGRSPKTGQASAALR